ncbi:MAG: type IV pilus assembly protein PilM [bacterium]|nr:type IV pilus assembly protein PilM [bacterium]
MSGIFSIRPPAFGLDISDLSIKIVDISIHTPLLSLRRDTAYARVGVTGETRMEQGIVEKGEIKNQEKLRDSIYQAVSSVSSQLSGKKHVVVSLPEEPAFVQVIQLPRMKEEEALRAVPFEAENYIPYPLDSVILDFEILPSSPDQDHLDVLLCAFPREIVNEYVEAIRGAGLVPIALEIESLSCARALIKSGISSVPVMIIDLGEVRTGIAVFSDSSLRFTTSIQISGKQFTEAIMNSLHIEQREAEALKCQHGLVSKEGGQALDVSRALIPFVSDLAKQARRYMDFYESHEEHRHVSLKKETRVQKIYLCGGGTNLKGIVPFLTKELNIEVKRGNPWANVDFPPNHLPPLSLPDALRYTTAIGLALRGSIYD